jgi:hypothetical protein
MRQDEADRGDEQNREAIDQEQKDPDEGGHAYEEDEGQEDELDDETDYAGVSSSSSSSMTGAGSVPSSTRSER